MGKRHRPRKGAKEGRHKLRPAPAAKIQPSKANPSKQEPPSQGPTSSRKRLELDKDEQHATPTETESIQHRSVRAGSFQHASSLIHSGDKVVSQQCGRKRRASEDLDEHSEAKAPKLTRPVESTQTTDAKTKKGEAWNMLLKLQLKVNDIFYVPVVDFQLDNKPVPLYNSTKKQTYFRTYEGEYFCAKDRMHIVTKLLPEDVECVPLLTHNGDGLNHKRHDDDVYAGYMSVRDTRKYPLNDPRVKFEKQGFHWPLLTKDMYGPWEIVQETTAKLVTTSFPLTRLGIHVGSIDDASGQDLKKEKEKYPKKG